MICRQLSSCYRERTEYFVTLEAEIDQHCHAVTTPSQTSGPLFTQESRTVADWLNVSHELRTPTNAILGHVELLLSGALGPLSAEARLSLGDIQRAGFGLLTQVDQAIELGQKLSLTDKLSAPESSPAASSSPKIDSLLDLLDKARSRAEPTAADLAELTSHHNDEGQRQSSHWLKVAATLLHQLDARPPRIGRSAPSNASLSCDIDHTHRSELRLEYFSSDHPDAVICVSMIAVALGMTGGTVVHNPGQLSLIWPVKKTGSDNQYATI